VADWKETVAGWVVSAVIVVGSTWCAMTVLDHSIGGSQLKHNKLREECVKARAEFFTDCYKNHTRSECEVGWALKRDVVFKYDPIWDLAEPLDCSKAWGW
jgi:hypothetical protein